MADVVVINNQGLEIKEWNNQRVITFKDIDMLHQRKEGTAKWNFNHNKKYFIENEDYFFVSVANTKKCENPTFEIPTRGITLLTEQGYLMVVKSLTDNLAWQVQRALVNNYFRSKQIMKQDNTVSTQNNISSLISQNKDLISQNKDLIEILKQQIYNVKQVDKVVQEKSVPKTTKNKTHYDWVKVQFITIANFLQDNPNYPTRDSRIILKQVYKELRYIDRNLIPEHRTGKPIINVIAFNEQLKELFEKALQKVLTSSNIKDVPSDFKLKNIKLDIQDMRTIISLYKNPNKVGTTDRINNISFDILNPIQNYKGSEVWVNFVYKVLFYTKYILSNNNISEKDLLSLVVSILNHKNRFKLYTKLLQFDDIKDKLVYIYASEYKKSVEETICDIINYHSDGKLLEFIESVKRM